MELLSNNELLKYAIELDLSVSKRRKFSDNFKFTIASLFLNRLATKEELIQRYRLNKSVLNKWIALAPTGSFKTERKYTAQQKELKKLEKLSKKLDINLDLILQICADLLSDDEKIALIDKNKEYYNVHELCKKLNFSRDKYYASIKMNSTPK